MLSVSQRLINPLQVQHYYTIGTFRSKFEASEHPIVLHMLSSSHLHELNAA